MASLKMALAWIFLVAVEAVYHHNLSAKLTPRLEPSPTRPVTLLASLNQRPTHTQNATSTSQRTQTSTSHLPQGSDNVNSTAIDVRREEFTHYFQEAIEAYEQRHEVMVIQKKRPWIPDEEESDDNNFTWWGQLLGTAAFAVAATQPDPDKEPEPKRQMVSKPGNVLNYNHATTEDLCHCLESDSYSSIIYWPNDLSDDGSDDFNSSIVDFFDDISGDSLSDSASDHNCSDAEYYPLVGRFLSAIGDLSTLAMRLEHLEKEKTRQSDMSRETVMAIDGLINELATQIFQQQKVFKDSVFDHRSRSPLNEVSDALGQGAKQSHSSHYDIAEYDRLITEYINYSWLSRVHTSSNLLLDGTVSMEDAREHHFNECIDQLFDVSSPAVRHVFKNVSNEISVIPSYGSPDHYSWLNAVAACFFNGKSLAFGETTTTWTAPGVQDSMPSPLRAESKPDLAEVYKETCEVMIQLPNDFVRTSSPPTCPPPMPKGDTYGALLSWGNLNNTPCKRLLESAHFDYVSTNTDVTPWAMNCLTEAIGSSLTTTERYPHTAFPTPSPPPTSQDFHICSYCFQSYQRPGDLTKHLKNHEKPVHCPYQHCESRFATIKDLKRHIKGPHGSGSEEHICMHEECRNSSVKFSRKDNLLRHMKTKHTGS